jgi:hypothetical protein
MAKYARVDNAIVVETWDDSQFPGTTPDQIFGTVLPGQWIACPDNVEAGWTYTPADGFKPPAGTAGATPVYITLFKRQLLRHLFLHHGKSETDVMNIINAEPNADLKNDMLYRWQYPDQGYIRYGDPLANYLISKGLFSPNNAQTCFIDARNIPNLTGEIAPQATGQKLVDGQAPAGL